MASGSARGRVVAGCMAVLLVAACGGGGGGGGGGEKAEGGRDTGKATAGGRILAKSDFVLATNGLPFENYGNQPGVTNLVPDDMRAVYGDVVCASTADGTCLLSPPAQLEMEFWNEAMAGGHCFGFSVASLQFSKAQLAPDPFGAPKVPDLVLEGNAALQRKLAQGFMAQGYPRVREQALTGPPSAVIEFLTAHFKDKTNSETYTLGFFKPDGTGGHAVTPYAIVDRGAGKVGLRIYDNNFPGQVREMKFDLRKDAWSYYASPNPDEPESEYFGDAALDTLELYPTSPGLGTQPCWFCGDPDVPPGDEAFFGKDGLGKLFVTGSPTDQPNVLLTDAKGRRTGYADGKLRREIPGVKVEHYYFANQGEVSAQPVYRVPLDAKVTVTLEGSGEKNPDEAKVGFTGPGFAVAVGNLEVDPGQTDEITLPSGGENFSYEAGDDESPTFQVGAEFAEADYALALSPDGMKKGSSVELDFDAKHLDVDTTGKVGDLDVVIDRVDEGGKETFDASGLTLDPEATGTFEIDEFEESGDSVTFETSEDGETTSEEITDEDTPDAEAYGEETGPSAEPEDEEGEDDRREGTSTSTSTTTTAGGPGETTTITKGAPAETTDEPETEPDSTEPGGQEQEPGGDGAPGDDERGPGSEAPPPAAGEPTTTTTKGQKPATTTTAATTTTTRGGQQAPRGEPQTPQGEPEAPRGEPDTTGEDTAPVG